MAHAFRIVNVFTVDGDRFSGNPLCVFEDARGLSEVQMQALARQLNLSETTFVLPPTREGADHHVRIFTPGFEMPFAGHPTLGTTSVIAAGRERVVLEMKAGLVAVTTDGTAWTLKTARAPDVKKVAASRTELCAMLGLPDGSVSDEPLWVNTGSEQLVIPVASKELVRAAAPKYEQLVTHGTSPTREEAMAYVWAKGEPGETDHLVRFFFTLTGGVVEDPATGSACANLGGWHLATKQPLPVSITLRQGEAVQRPSRLALRVETDGGVYVTGTVIELGRGSVEV